MRKVGLRSLPFKAQRRERARRWPHSELMFVWKFWANGSRLDGKLTASYGGETIEDI
jgi:hypothetical protein